MIEKSQASFRIRGQWYRATDPDHFFKFAEREDVTSNIKSAFRQYQDKYPGKVEVES